MITGVGAGGAPAGAARFDARWYRWPELKRHEVVELAREREGVVVVPLGAIEQHGPFLPTGADIMLSTLALEGALDRAAGRSERPFILAPFLGIGCSAHHLPFGGTISLSSRVMGEVLVEAMLSMRESGVRRIVLVNGHGGNTGVCHAAASEAASGSDLTVAMLDYWSFAAEEDDPASPVPGHAGRFETSLLLAARPELVADDREYRDRSRGVQPGRGVYGRAVWAGIDGFTDRPDDGTEEAGRESLEHIERRLASRLVQLAEEMP